MCSFFSTPVLIRHLWQLKTVVFLHRCLISPVPLKLLLFVLALEIDVIVGAVLKTNLLINGMVTDSHFRLSLILYGKGENTSLCFPWAQYYKTFTSVMYEFL
jgi:hypothetical protein